MSEQTITLSQTEYLKLLRKNQPRAKRQEVDFIDGEKWKRIDAANGIYSTSNFGRFRKTYRDQQGRLHDQIMKQRPLNGSMSVSLTISPGNTIGVQSGRAILMTWKPQEDQHKKLVGYKDGDFRNLKLENLFWATKGELKDHKNSLGQLRRKLVQKEYKTAYGEIKYKTVLFSEADKAKMKEMYATGITQSVIAEQFKATQSYVSKIIRNK